jgi:hypothetical protein
VATRSNGDATLSRRGTGTPRLETVLGQPSWSFGSGLVRATLTRCGGHLAPVTFTLESGKTVQPFAVAPWAERKLPRGVPDLLRSLRGDFFCCPFGGNGSPWRGERHPPHGETANGSWSLVSLKAGEGRSTLHARLRTRVRKGQVDKFLTLIDDHTALYSCHVISGMQGPMSVGHHALLKFPAQAGGRVSTSRFEHGQVLPSAFESPEEGGYQSLRPGAAFRSLKRVPRQDGSHADLTVFPARPGYDDLVLLAAPTRLPFAWSAVTFRQPSHVWFALRDPRSLRSTLLWMSNGGRHYPPWNGEHSRVLGIEDVTANFHYGLAESARSNPLRRRGIATALPLDRGRPTTIRYIMGVAAVPMRFDQVADIRPVGGGVELVASNGLRSRARIDLGFLDAGSPRSG